MTLSSAVKMVISSTFFSSVEETMISKETTAEAVVEWVLRDMGINAHMGGDYFVGRCPDQVINSDSEGRWLTFVGHQLVTSVRSFDWETPWEDRSAGRAPVEGEELITWGDSYYEYYGIVPVNPRLSDSLVGEIVEFIAQQAPCWIEGVLQEQEDARKAWGRRQNSLLREAGCSDQARKSWWGLSWKHEWSPEEWSETVASTSVEALSTALRAHAGWALDDLGFGKGVWHRSFPRRMDALQGLAKALKVKACSKRAYNEWLKRAADGVDVAPSKVTKDGRAIWTF